MGNDWSEFAIANIEAATGDGLVIFFNGGNGVPVAMEAMAMVDPQSRVAAFGKVHMGR